MWLMIAGILLVCWLLGFAVFHIAGGLIHILIVVAIIMVVLHFIQGRGRTL
jgi:Family of unknown function (DUF5670)